MSLIRNLFCGVMARGDTSLRDVVKRGACVVALSMCGCLEQPANPPVQAMNDTPIAEDRAMQLRNWDKSHLYYANVGTDAGPQGMSFQLTDKNPRPVRTIADPALFLGNDLLLPLHLMRVPPWATIEARGSTIPPSYTAMPKLDPQ